MAAVAYLEKRLEVVRKSDVLGDLQTFSSAKLPKLLQGNCRLNQLCCRQHPDLDTKYSDASGPVRLRWTSHHRADTYQVIKVHASTAHYRIMNKLTADDMPTGLADRYQTNHKGDCELS